MRAFGLASLLPLCLACRETPVAGSGVREAAARLDEVTVPRDPARARELFAAHCALCHGPTGEGDGEAALLLYPPARDFTLGFFRLASTENSVPTEEDLVLTLRRGMPGSAMPPFGWMAERDLRDLAQLVRALARDGLLRDLHAQAVDDGAALDPDEARAIVASWLEPGERVEPLPPADPTPALLGYGRQLFLRHCAVCHGLDGRGRGGEPKRHEDGSLTWARDFTAGILKGGGTRYELTCRIQAGMGGSAMPPSELSQSDLTALVAYVQALIPTGAPERHRQLRTGVVAERIDAAPTAADWAECDEQLLHMAPLAWSDQAVLDVRVAALNDGQRLWIRLRWDDPTRDDRVVGGEPFVDAAAIQFTTGSTPPLFGMGAAGAPVNLWHWSAARWSELAGLLDPLAVPVHGDRQVVDEHGRVDVPLYRAAPDSTEAVVLEAEGFRRIDEEGGELGVDAAWVDGGWELVLSRRLGRRGPREVDLKPGSTVQFGVALWNGAAGDHRGQKSITIWHELLVAR